MDTLNPSLLLTLQIFVIVIFARLCAYVVRFVGQPKVIGEMLAGILLGSSVLGLLWSTGFSYLFPDSSMPTLKFISQVGLVLFMFVVGIHLRVEDLKNKAAAAVMISYSSIIMPFVLGMLLAFGIYDNYGPQGFSVWTFALFMGIALSITAFPVLARILQEKKLDSTPLGQMALACAAVDDVTAWCILAAVVGIAKAGTASGAVVVLAASALYVFVMWYPVRSLARRLLSPSEKLSWWQLGFIFSVLLASALVTEKIGIHVLFGAFFAGVVLSSFIPRPLGVIQKVGDFSSLFLLPVFFAYTGLRLQILLLEGSSAWLVCGLILFLAIFGKMVGSAVAARRSGMSWQESWALGSLMNTRGLMELVVLNIGYDLGILSPTLFAMMVIMALVTTAMTSPLVSALYKRN